MSSNQDLSPSQDEHRLSPMGTTLVSDTPELSASEPYFSGVDPSNMPSHDRRNTWMPQRRVDSSRDSITEHVQGAAEESWKELEEFDWSTTKLGPRHTWPEAIDTLLGIVFQSQSQDSIWLGEDMHMLQ
jgi:hypothetical protein